MESDFKQLISVKLVSCSVLVACSMVAHANSTVIVDGSLKTSYNQGVGISHTLSNNSHLILIDGNTDGKIQNTNLFFSFSQFNVGTGDTAQFTCTTCQALSNVISRVTDGKPSFIQGTLDSTQIPGANFWLINPSGVLFGPGSSVNVPAAFHVSNATKIMDSTGTSYFSANPLDNNSSLNISPTAFGFTGLEHNGVSMDGATITAGGGPNNYAMIDIEGTTINIGPYLVGQANSPDILNGAGINIESLGNLNVSAGLVLNDAGGASPGSTVTAGGALSLQGDGVNSGVIRDNRAVGDLTITAPELDLGMAGSWGGIYNIGSSSGAMTINAGILNFTSNSIIKDSGTGGGNLNVNVSSGGLRVGIGDGVTKNTAGELKLAVSGALYNMGRLGLDTVNGVSGASANISADSVTNTGSIIGALTGVQSVSNTGAITGSVTAQNGSVGNTAGSISGAVTAGQNVSNTGAITGSVTAQNGSVGNTAGLMTGAVTAGQNVSNTGTISGNVIAQNGNVGNTAGSILGAVTAGQNVSNTGAITGSVTAQNGSVGNNAGSIIGAVIAGQNVSNTGTIVGSVSAQNGNVANTAGSITGAVAAQGNVVNSGSIQGDVTATRGNVTNNPTGVINGNVMASGAGAGNIYDYGRIVLNSGSTTQSVIATNDLIVDGSVHVNDYSGSIVDNQTQGAGASINAGNALILNQGSLNNSGGEPLLLTARSLNMTSSRLISNGSVNIENPGYQVSNPINPISMSLNDSIINAKTLDLGYPERLAANGGSVVAGQEFILTATNQSKVIVSGEFGQHSNFVIDLNSNNSIFSGNPIYLQTANKNALEANTNNLFEPASFPLSVLQNGILFINATGVQISAPSNSVVASEIILVARPLEIPAVPSDPCTTGSNLELKNSRGVLPAFSELLPFSVFYASGGNNSASVLLESVNIKLASNAVKKLDCGKT